jgi:hypothetical protein
MTYRALFIGGAVDGQERVLAADYGRIQIPARTTPPVIYRLLFPFGKPRTLVYSMYDVETTLNRLWHRYAGEDRT